MRSNANVARAALMVSAPVAAIDRVVATEKDDGLANGVAVDKGVETAPIVHDATRPAREIQHRMPRVHDNALKPDGSVKLLPADAPPLKSVHAKGPQPPHGDEQQPADALLHALRVRPRLIDA